MTPPFSGNAFPDRFFIPDADPNYVYRWSHPHERVMNEREYQGWEVVLDPPKAGTPPPVLPPGQATETPGGGIRRQRGEMICLRIPRPVWEERIRAPKQKAREEQAASIDTMVAEANEYAKRQVRQRTGQAPTRDLVFREDVDD